MLLLYLWWQVVLGTASGSCLGIAKDGQTMASSLAGRGDTAHPQGEQERVV